MRWPFALKHDAQDQHPTGGAGTNTGAKVSVRQFGTGAKVSWCWSVLGPKCLVTNWIDTHTNRTTANDKYFVDKIVKLRNSVNDSLHLLSVPLSCDLSFPSYHGSTLNTLSPVTADEVRKVLIASPAKSSNMDIIPTSLILRCQGAFSEIIAHIAHLSFLEGRFPATFKHASVTPLLKGHALDKSVPSNYRPISNLNFIS